MSWLPEWWAVPAAFSVGIILGWWREGDRLKNASSAFHFWAATAGLAILTGLLAQAGGCK